MRLYIFAFLALAFSQVAMAEIIPAGVAENNARRFLDMMPAKSRSGSGLTAAQAPAGLYVFNIGDGGGYVIASASDATQAVLGYSDSGRIDMTDMPDAAKWWLGQLGQTVLTADAAHAGATGRSSVAMHASSDRAAIAPLVKSRWNQGDPYNLMTPSYIDGNGNVQPHSATGCVATATTQMMYYWKWPQGSTTAIPSYTYNWSNNSRTMPELPPTVFDWDKMTDTYSGSSPQESKDEVAKLMLYAGCGMQSGYAGATGATTGNALNALKNYFGYAQNAYIANQLDYTYQEWEELFYNELSAGRPLQMGADNYERTGGHEFICDGYDGKGFFHINWGWGGYCDGYFALTVMAPDSQGIGGSTDANGYSMGQNVIINLRPQYSGDEETVCASISNFYSTQKSYASGTGISIRCTLRTLLLNGYSVEHAFRLTDSEGRTVADAIAPQTMFFDPSRRYTVGMTLNLGTLADGTYTLRGISRRAGGTEWLTDLHGDRNYLEMTVADGRITVTAKPGQGNALTVNSIKLEGATKAGEWQRVIYNITNGGADFFGDTYMFVDGVRSSGNTISIPAGTTSDIYYKFKPDGTPGAHRFALSKTTREAEAFHVEDRMYNIDCVWDAAGKVEALPAAGNAVPATATAVYLYGESPRTMSLAEAGRNLILYFDSDANVPARVQTIYRRSAASLVFGNRADEAVFTDGCPVYIPKEFTAGTARYSRTFATAWSTLAIPFAATSVATADGVRLDWFRSLGDTGKNLYLKKFSGRRGTKVMFAYEEGDAVQANAAYLIGVENGSFSHLGKEIVFSASDATVGAASETVLDAGTETPHMVPCFSNSPVSGAYAMDDPTGNFVKVGTGVPGVPFRGYMVPLSQVETYSVLYGEGELGAVGNIRAESTDGEAPVYNLQGIKVGTTRDMDSLPTGLYISSGKKILKK